MTTKLTNNKPSNSGRRRIVVRLTAAAAVAAAAAAAPALAIATSATAQPLTSPTGSVVIRYGAPVTVPASGPTVRDAFAQCASTEHLVGGGANTADVGAPIGGIDATWATYITQSNPSNGTLGGAPPNGTQTTGAYWHVQAVNTSGGHPYAQSVTLQAYALCSS